MQEMELKSTSQARCDSIYPASPWETEIQSQPATQSDPTWKPNWTKDQQKVTFQAVREDRTYWVL